MNGKRGLIAIVVVLVAIVALASIAYGALAPQAQQNAGTTTNPTSQDSAAENGTDATEAGSSTSSNAEAEGANAASGESSSDMKFPGFTVADIDGNNVSLDDLLAQGKPVFLGYWATWCPPCMQESPEIQKLYEQYGDKVTFAMVNATDGSRETVESATEWYKAQGYAYPIYLDVNYEAASAGGVMYLPTTYMLDTQGNVLYYSRGALTFESGSKVIEDALAS